MYEEEGLFMKRFKAFTLAELMVAMAVIGILVAIVTPAVVKTRPNKNKMMVKKTFYTTENIVSSLINDERVYPDMRDLCYDGGESTDDEVYCAWGFDYTTQVNYEGTDVGGNTKFRDLFVNKLNVKQADATNSTYYTNDGVKWVLSGTNGAWTSEKTSVGTFDAHGNDTAGMGTITIDVNGDEGPNAPCTADNEDCDQYEIQLLANGKMRINPEHTRANEYVTINTSIRDGL